MAGMRYRNTSMFSKLFSSILDSSVWMEQMGTRIVWFTLLAAKDQDGFARFATPENLALRARVTKEECAEAIRLLESPDPNSSNPDHEGRRIERVPGGWVVLNAKLYDQLASLADRREQTRQRVAKHRKQKSTGVNTSQQSQPRVKPEHEPTDPAFEEFWRLYPRRSGGNPKQPAWQQWKAQVKWGTNPLAMQDGAVRYAKSCEAEGTVGTKYVMQAVKFIGKDRHFTEPYPLPETNGNGKMTNTEKAREALRDMDGL